MASESSAHYYRYFALLFRGVQCTIALILQIRKLRHRSHNESPVSRQRPVFVRASRHLLAHSSLDPGCIHVFCLPWFLMVLLIHSKNLVNWMQLPHLTVLTRRLQRLALNSSLAMDAEEAMKQDAEQPLDTESLVEGVRTLLRSLEVRQQHLLANIASCDELMAEITSLQAALWAPARTEDSSLPVQEENKNS